MRPLRRIIPSILRSIVAVSFIACVAGASFAQTPGEIPHAWTEAVYSLAQKIAAALGSTQAFSLDLKDISAAAPVELATARDKLARAEKANADHNPKPAALLADQANIDAQVAEAMAAQARSRKAATEFDTSMQALRQESARASQPAQ